MKQYAAWLMLFIAPRMTACPQMCKIHMTIYYKRRKKSVATVYIRTSRYTHEFVDANEYFTISFYPEEYKKVLGILGSKSGRDMDKMRGSGLTPKYLDKGITFEEAKYTLVCRKLFKQQLAIENIPEEVVYTYYKKDAPHDMYIAEVIEILT